MGVISIVDPKSLVPGVLCALLWSAGGVGQSAQAQPGAKGAIPPTVPYTTSAISAAPAGGLDPAKLPDLVGIHIGEPTDQVIAELKKFYPRNGNAGNPQIRTQGYAYTSDPFYTSSVSIGKPNLDGCTPTDCQAQDTFNALFSGPPDQRAVELVRSLTWGMKKQPATATLRTALIQKYGHTFDENTTAGMMTWLFDEEGRPIPPQSRAAAMNCGGLLAFGGGTAVRLPDYLYRSPPPQVVTQQDLDRFAKLSCGRKVFVQAQLFQSGGVASSLIVTIREYAADLRDAFAAENLMRQAKLSQGNQQLKNAQQQAAPAF